MKTVFSNDEIAHIWAHNGQESARNSNGSMSFNGNNFYSYRTIIAKRIGTTVLMSSRNYSNTTNKHQSHVRGAARGVVYCHDVNDSAAQNFAVLTRNVLAFVDRQTRAKKVDYILQAEREITEFKQYAELIGYKMSANTVEGIAAAEGKRIKKDKAARAKMERTRKQEAAAFMVGIDTAKIERAYRVARECYHAGHDSFYRAINTTLERLNYKAHSHGVKIPVTVYPDLMRVSRDGGVITSRGVNITLNEARGLYEALRAGRDVTGARISHYRIDEITADYVKAGCHMFPRSELGYISKKLFGEAV